MTLVREDHPTVSNPHMQAAPRRRTTWLALAAAAALIAGPLAVPAVAAADPGTGLVAHYELDETGAATVAVDSSGNQRDATYVGGPTLTGGEGVRLDGADDYVKLPDNIMAGLSSITVSAEALVRPEQGGSYFIWGFGNTGGDGVGNGYLFTTGNDYRASISDRNWTGEQGVNSGTALPRGVWKTLTYTLDSASKTSRLYLDGVEVAKNTNTTLTPAAIGNGVTTADYIGRSVYNADARLAGSVRDFRIYDRALSAGDVAALVPTASERVTRDAAQLDLGARDAVTTNLTLPTSAPNGSTISWATSDAGVISTAGVVTRPTAGQNDATVVLTATMSLNGATEQKSFDVTVKAMPDDARAVDAALGAVSIPSADDVRGNITLPASAGDVALSWVSSDPSAVSTDGVVVRGEADTTVTLTVTATRGSVSRTRDIVLTVRAAAHIGPFAGYTFSYFTGNSVAGENIYFAASNGNNALSWTDLNGGRPALTSTYGEKGLRDPFILRSPEGDTFYLIATDLSIGRNGDWGRAQRQGSKYIEVWESHDLVNWSAQRHVKIGPDNAGNTWAPEAYYDDQLGAYVVFWAASLFGENDPKHEGGFYQTMMYATTRDFVTFSEPKVWQDLGASRIDSTVLKVGDSYQRFTKDEGSVTGCADIIQESSKSLTAVDDRSQPGWSATNRNWKLVDSCIGRDAGVRGAVEGPTIFAANPGDTSPYKYYLFVDEYGGQGYIPLGTNDITAPDWKIAGGANLPPSPRHGTVMPVTASELEALRANLPAGPDPVTANEKGEVLRYDFTDGSGATLHDRSGAGRDAKIMGDAVWSNGSLTFDGANDYVQMPDNVLAGVTDVTVDAELRIDSAQANPYFLYGFGNTAGNEGNGYLFATGDGTYRGAIARGNYTTEQNAQSGSALPRNRWVHLTYTLSGGTARLYLDGVQVAVNTDVTVTPADLGNGSTVANVIGKSLYAPDNLFRGQYREFALYNRALSPQEVLDQSGNQDVLGAVSLADESALKMAPIVDADTRTVTFPVVRGTDLSTLQPVYATASGVTASPASGVARDLRSPSTVALKRDGKDDVVWTLKAVEVKSPVLPGLYADPNIAVFGDTYYIYATSDGVPGWGGNTFYVWSSKNLVDWKRSEQPFLTLDGADGNVPWASGNAWAPTITERGGKYYFYFSGHSPELDRKVIGVAVADSPIGPFVAQPQPMIRNDESVASGQAIDPAAFQDPKTGKYYLFWGNGSPLYAQLSDDMTSVVPGTIRRIDGLSDFREGIFMNYRDGLYHLTYSIDDTGSPDYRVGYATSTSIDGPWQYRGVILQKNASLGILGTGHSSIINVPGTDDWYIAYHRFAIPGGDGTHRETTIDRLTIGPDGSFQPVTPTLSSVAPEAVPSGPTPTPTPTPSPTGSPTASPSPSATVSPSASPSASPSPRVEVSASTVERGGSVRITVSGLHPGEQVTAELHSDPIRIGGIPVADASGRVAFDVQVPSSLPVGAHTVFVWDGAGVLIAQVPLQVLPAGQLAVTGAQAPWAFALLAALLLMGGVGLRVVRPARGRTSA